MFVVTNIITSIFVDTAISSSNLTREEIVQDSMRERDYILSKMTAIFQEADVGDLDIFRC